MHSLSEKILIIQDTPEQQAVLCNLVSELGLTPICPVFFDYGIIETIQGHSIKLVLTDLILVDGEGYLIGNGFQICSDIKSFDSSVKVVVVSEESDQAALMFAKAQGADDFICKPFKTEEFENCIHALGISTKVDRLNI